MLMKKNIVSTKRILLGMFISQPGTTNFKNYVHVLQNARSEKQKAVLIANVKEQLAATSL
jgi:hypothetical protein